MIKTAVIISDDTLEDEVGIGKKVTVKFLKEDEIEEFKIVTTVEADPLNNMISIESPLGKVLYKHKVGEILKVNSPEGEYTIKIEKIETK